MTEQQEEGAWKRWDQKLEVEFIRNLGNYSEAHKKSRAELLRNYIKAHPLRKRWMGIKADRMLALAERCLAEEEGVRK